MVRPITLALLSYLVLAGVALLIGTLNPKLRVDIVLSESATFTMSLLKALMILATLITVLYVLYIAIKDRAAIRAFMESASSRWGRGASLAAAFFVLMVLYGLTSYYFVSLIVISVALSFFVYLILSILLERGEELREEE